MSEPRFEDSNKPNTQSRNLGAFRGVSLTAYAAAHQRLLTGIWHALGRRGEPENMTDIVGALESQLAAALALGRDVALQLTGVINSAVNETARQLQAEGLDADKINRLLARFREQLSAGLERAAQSILTDTSLTR